MAKGSVVKPPVSKNVDVETVVIDDEEQNPIMSDVNRGIQHDFILNPTDDSPPAFNNDLWVDPAIDPQDKGKTVEANLPGFYQDGHMIHPLFVNCLLDKIHRMEVRFTEMVAHRDIMEA